MNLAGDHRGYVYEYDMENRLTTVRRPDSTVVAAFDYDALGRRIETVDAIAGTTTRYYYDDQRVAVQTRVASGVETDFRYYVFGNYIDEVLVMGYRLGTSWLNFFYGHDHLYSPVGIFAPSGTLMERYEYDAYGKVRITGIGPDAVWFTADDAPRTTSLYANPYTFTGRELDTLDNNTLHLMYYRARTTDPETGSFMQRDPEQYEDSSNLYQYVKSNSLLNTDAQGLKACHFTDIGILPPTKTEHYWEMGNTNCRWHVELKPKRCGFLWMKWKASIYYMDCSGSYWYSDDQKSKSHELRHVDIWNSVWDKLNEKISSLTTRCTCNKSIADCYVSAGHLWARAYLAQADFENWGYEVITYNGDQKNTEMYRQLREYLNEWTALKANARQKEEECNRMR